MGEEGRLLEDHPDAPLLGRHPAPWTDHHPPTDLDPAGIRLLEAGDQAQERRLAAARWSEDRQELAARHAEVDRVDGGHLAVVLREP